MNASSENPFGVFRRECEWILRETLERSLPPDVFLSQPVRDRIASPSLQIPPTLEFGDLASSICLEVAGKFNIAPKQLADTIIQHVDLSKASLTKDVKSVGGYLNFYVHRPRLSQLTLESATTLAEAYGYITALTPRKIIVEHTSVNPAGPIHVGTARNSILGDSLAHLLAARGHTIATHFYIDDVGRQIAVLAYGYDLLKRPKAEGKPDHWIGQVYAITSCIIEIEKLKRKLKELESNDALHEQANKTRLLLDDWVSAAAELQERDEKLFWKLLENIQKDAYPEESIAHIMRRYEKNDPEVRKLVRDVVELCLEGFQETYSKVGIVWNSWDWESDLVWSGAVSDIVNKLGKSPYATTVEGTLALNIDAAADEMRLKERFGVPREHEIPSLVLTRSDETTLYSTRDIAYSLWKLNRADKVINVIGVEQSLAQLQIRIALGILTSPETAERLIHYTYELVKLPGYRMSKRRGRYITFDEILNEAIKRAREEVNKRSPQLPSEQKEAIAEAVGIGAVKYTLIDVAPSKQVSFTWDKVLNFETNSAPFIQYAYARACNILEKAEHSRIEPDYTLLKEDLELEIIRQIALFPDTFVSAADSLSPNLITEFAYNLASRFNSFYASLPVLRAEPRGLRSARLALVKGVRITLQNALNLLGIEALERM